MKTEIISFYSDVDNHTYYSDHAKRLSENCKSLNIPHDIRHLESHNDYRLNCLRKPKYIREMLLEKEKPLVWLDVDSIVHQELKVFDDKEKVCDVIFAYNMTHHEKDFNVLMPKASPIYVNNTAVVHEFLDFWVQQCELNLKTGTKVFDHEILLYRVLPFFSSKLRIGVLPKNYAIWPDEEFRLPENLKPVITIGVSTTSSKEKSLREMGMPESAVDVNMNRTNHQKIVKKLYEIGHLSQGQ